VKRVFLFALIAGLAILNSAQLFAQFETASVLGYVRDSSGAVVPSATVTLVNRGTGVGVTLKTNGEGSYEFTDVKIGSYQVKALASGFDTTTTQPFQVQVNAHQRVDVALKVAGAAPEEITVSGAAALLETDSSERGQVIGTSEVENLPLNGRAYADLAALVPGVRRNILENSTDSSRDASFNVNGQRSEFNNFLLDGLDNNAYGTSNQGFSNQAIPPSPDAISEFRVETDNYSAEYGRSAGAVINVSIRSGTNQYHGKAYEYVRNTVFNAVGPFTAPSNPLTGAPQKPVLLRNQFGATFGGPVWKDRLFFFADYEGTRQVVHAVNTATVPTANQLGISALAKANGGYTFQTASNGTESGTAVHLVNPLTGQTYPNGVIPFNDASVSAFAKGVIAALPTPNVAGDPFASNYVSLPPDLINDDKGDIRIDATISPKTTAFGRYSEHQGNILSPPNIQGPAGGNSNGSVKIFNQQGALGVTHVFNQSSILDARFAFTLTDGGKGPYGATLSNLMAGIPGLPTSPTVTRSLNVQSVNGYSQFGNQGSNPQFQNPYVFNPKINYTQIRGRSTYKVGYEYQAIFTKIDDFNPVYGQDTYNGGFSYGINSPVSSTDTGTKEGVALADFLFGARDSFQLNNFAIVHLNQRMNYFYVQDDVRLSSKLTVNAGLRYELATPQWEKNNRLANYDPTTQSLITASSGSIYNRALVNMAMLDFAPRLGAAYSINPKTVVRAGYGLSYAQFNREGGENLLVYNLPNIVNTNVVQYPQFADTADTGSAQLQPVCTTAQAGQAYSPANPTPCFRVTSQGYPTNLANPANVTAASNLTTEARYIPKDLPTGYVQAYHFTVQRQVGPSTTVEASYVGSHGVKLETLADLNQAPANTASATCDPTVIPPITKGCLNLAARRPIPTFTTIEETLPLGALRYNGLQAKVEHRTGHGLYLLNSFTWSRAIDNVAGHLDTPDGDNSRVNLANLRGEFGPSAYNQPLNDVLSIVYDLPVGKGRTFAGNAPFLLQEAIGGWQLTAINSASSGLPVNIMYSPNGAQQLSPLLNQRPNQAPGNPVIPKSQRIKTSAGQQNIVALNAALFTLPVATGTTPYGNAGRNSVRFDAFHQTDIGLHKNFALYRDRASFDFRCEAFNIFNQTNYAYPASNLSSSNFGQVTASTTFPARILQFAGKIVF
jgi:hypothetical protein